MGEDSTNSDMNEPTMEEKLGLVEGTKMNATSLENGSSVDFKVPSADSIEVMLRQALNADDRELLLKCLYSRDDKVISNSVSYLNPSDALKLLNSLISLTQSRGSVLVCALPWLRSLLLEHASSIVAQESSLFTLNSLYQLIESRTSTFGSAIQLSTCLDHLFAGILDEEVENENIPPPVIYEDKDSDEESDGDMETDDSSGGEFTAAGHSHDSDYSDVMSQ